MEHLEHFIRLWTVDEVASMLGFCRKSVLAWIHSGALQAIRIGSDWRIAGPAISRFLSDHEHRIVNVTDKDAPEAGEAPTDGLNS